MARGGGRDPLRSLGTPLVKLTWYFLSLNSLALTRMFLKDFPPLYDKRGGSLKISFDLGWFCIWCHFSLSRFLRLGSAGQYCVTNGNIFFRAV